ncbi:MAG: ABC transporter ATP-binding protein [Eubacteriales bacterium]|nr:ABC transporter ATP-binding protein [Eubacteriales bacterium]
MDRLTLHLSEKKIYCLLGRNGAGKTTLMNLISGKIRADEGKVMVDDERVTTLNMPESVRYIEAAKPQFNMRVSELMKLAAGVDDKFDADFADRMVDKFRLERHKKYKSLSFGMKTMVTTIISLASNSEIVLLDEPVLGFDAVMRKEFYDLLAESYENHPRIIIVSTHLIDEIAGIAEKIIAIDSGKLLFYEDINDVIEKSYKLSGAEDDVKHATANLNVVANEKIGKFAVAYVFDKRMAPQENVEVENLSLQDLFVKMVEGKN